MSRTGIDDGISRRLLRRVFALALGVAVSTFALMSGLGGLAPMLVIGIGGQLLLGYRFAQAEPIGSWRWAIWIGGPYAIPLLIGGLVEQSPMMGVLSLGVALPSWIGAEYGLRHLVQKGPEGRVQAARSRIKRVVALLRRSDAEGDRSSSDELERLLRSMDGGAGTKEALFKVCNLCHPKALAGRRIPGLSNDQWSQEVAQLKDRCADAFNELERT